MCINDLQEILMRLMSAREAMDGNISGSSTYPFTLIEPTIEYIIRYLFKDLKQVSHICCSHFALFVVPFQW